MMNQQPKPRERPSPGQIRWVAFDAVGTLIHPDPPVREVYHRVGERHGSRLSLEEIGSRFAVAFRSDTGQGNGLSNDVSGAWRSSEQIEHDRWRQIVTQVIPDVADPAACFEELFAHFAQPSAWKCYADVGDTLRLLKAAGYRLALASNFDNRLSAIRAAFVDLAPIDVCVISSLVGFRKPSREFYHALVSATGGCAKEILMIGDDLQNDVAGAKAAGLPALWLDRQGEGGLQTLAELRLILDLTD